MSTPIKIIVASDFGATNDTANLVALHPGQLDAVFSELRPAVDLSGPRRVQLTSLDDFAPANLKAQLQLGADSAGELTGILHDSRFQAVEAAWRGLALLALKTPGQGVLIEVLHTSFGNLRRRVLDCVIKPEYDCVTDVPTTVLLVDFEFLPHGETFDVLVDLAKMGEAVKVPVVCQTNAGFFGIKHLLHLPALKDPVGQFSKPQYAAYRAFRETDASFWVSLMLNRFLLRAPHEGSDYVEPHSASDPTCYLWGNAIWLLGANLIASFARKGHVIGLSGLGTGGEQLGLPTRMLPLSRTTAIKTPLEASFPQETTDSLPYLGLSPITQLPDELGGQNQPGMAYVHLAANLHHIQDPDEQQIGLLTVHTSLAYSMTMGRVSNLALHHRKALGSLPTEEAATKLAALLCEDLWHKDDSEIKITAKDGGVLSITYEPHLVIHTRRFAVELEING